MRRRSASLATVVAAVAVALLLGVGAGGATAAKKPPNRLLVRADEFNLTLSRAQIGPGPAIVQLFNGGEDPHNLQIRQQKGGTVKTIDELEPGATGEVELRFRKGARYQLWCSLLNHRQLVQ